MPLKFVTTPVTTTDGEAVVSQNGTTPEEKVIPTLLTLGSETGSDGTFTPDSVTEYTGDNAPLNGFSLSFTDGLTYDLDEILFNIRRDNPDSPLAVQVIKENSREEMLLQQATAELLVEYGTDNINNIPAFGDLVSTRYKEKLLFLDSVENSDAPDGSLVLNETQPKIGVTKADMLKYLLDPSPKKLSAPIINMERPLVVWSELQGDLNVSADFQTFDNIYTSLVTLQLEMDTNDGGDFVLEELDGGIFTQIEYYEEEDGGAF